MVEFKINKDKNERDADVDCYTVNARDYILPTHVQYFPCTSESALRKLQIFVISID